MRNLNASLYKGLLSEIMDVVSCRGTFVSNLAHFLTIFGASLGALPYVYWRSKNFPNLNMVIAADPGSGKGESLKIIQDVFDGDRHTDELLATCRYLSPVSGMKLVEDINNELYEREGETRFLQYTLEYSSLLDIMKIPATKLATIINNLTDGIEERVNIRRGRITLPPIHYSSINHITPDDLKSKLTGTLITGGYGSRLIIVKMPYPQRDIEPAEYPHATISAIRGKIFQSLQLGGERELVEMEDAAKERYKNFIENNNPIDCLNKNMKHLTVRFTNHCLKIALIIALVNQEDKISLETMEAACAYMDYSRATIDELFGSDPTLNKKDRILNFIEQRGEVTQTEIAQEFGGKFSTDEQHSLLDRLVEEKKLNKWETKKAFGRRAIHYSITA